MKYFLSLFSLFALLALLSMGGQSGDVVTASSSLDEMAVSEAFSSSPVMFIENVGQLDDGARFQVRGAAGTMWLASDALWLTILEANEGLNEHQGHAHPSPTDGISPSATLTSQPLLAGTGSGGAGVHLKLSFVGANAAPVLEPFNRLDTKLNTFFGNDPQLWQSDLPVWGGIRYKNLYAGIDLELLSQEGQLVQRLVVAEGADPSLLGASLAAVRLRVEGADEIELLPAQNRATGDGGAAGMRLMTAIGEVNLPLLQLVDAAGNALRLPAGESQVNGDEIRAPFSAISEDELESRAAASLAPNGITGYSTFLGGNGSDAAFTLALDSDGNAYVAGTTSSTTFPATPGFFDPTYNGGNSDVFMAKLNPAGNGLLYAIYLGGSGDEVGYSNNLAVDNTGNVYITGHTTSTDFPVTSGALDQTYNGGTDAFVFKLSAQGNGLFYGTYLGGSGNEIFPSLTIDASGNAYLTGATTSSDFPATIGAYDESYNEGDNDVFVAKLNNSGTGLSYATFIGGAGYDTGHDIELVGDEVLIVGAAGEGFPVTGGAFDTMFSGCGTYLWCDAFVARLNSAGNGLVYASYLGGNESDWLNEVTVDEQGQVFVIGPTESSDYPTSEGAFDSTFNGVLDMAVSKLDANASSLLFSTYIGGSAYDNGNQLVLDSDGSLVLAGGTQSLDMPITSDAIRLQLSGSQDAYLARLSADGSSLLYGSFLGGYYDDWGFGLEIAGNNNLYMTGQTASPNYPITTGAFDTSHNAGGNDAFVTQLTIGSGGSTTYSISGRVTLDSAIGAPIEGVRVSIDENLFAITDSEGNYTINNVPPGSYNLIPTKEGYLFEQPYPVASVPPNDTIDFVGTLAPGTPSTDSDGDGLLNETESNGWTNAAGTFMTDPNDPDSDHDGLWDGQEKQFDSEPNNDKSPGIYVLYDNSFKTKEYFGWLQYGNEYIALETAIVRRGTVFSVGGASGATIEVTPSMPTLTPLVPVYNAQSGRWDISIGLNNTVGKYTITLTEGEWSKSLTLAVIFELPTDLEQSQQGAYLYDDDPSNQRDEISIWFATSEQYASQSYWNHIANGFGLPFQNHQYKPYVFDIVIEAINGTYYQEYAIQKLAAEIDLLTRFDPAYYYFTMYDVLNSYQQRNQCSNIANALTSFSRSAGIAARPVLVDWDGYVTYSGYFDTATEVWLGGEWKTTRAYNVFTGGEDGKNPINGGILPPTTRETWGTYYYPQSISDIMVVAVPDWESRGLPQSQYEVVYKWDNANPNQIQRKEWVETVHIPYWGWVSEPTRTGDPALRRSQGADAQLSESYLEQAVDEDEDGSAEQLLIQTDIHVSTEGNYILSGELYDSENNRIMAQSLSYLMTGTQTMTIPFEGHDIFRLRVDGPYQLLIKLWNQDQSSLLDQDSYTTSGYAYTDFEAPAAYFTGNYSSSGEDSNDNGSFDDLILTAELNVSEPGNYTIIGYLGDKSENLSSKTGSSVVSQLQTELMTGTQNIELAFDGTELFINGIDGSYEVQEILITDIPNPTPADLVSNLIDSRRYIHSTDAYDYSEFETAGANVTGKYSDSGLDLDSDGKYEQLLINVGLNIAITQPYTMSAELHDNTGNLLGVASWSGISAFAQLQFDGLTIYNNGMDGPYQLRYLRLENANHEIIAFIDSPHTTEAYNYDDFDSPAATLTEQYNDYGQDSNGNQLYEELMIEVELAVSEAGLYLIEGWLIDENGRSVTWASSESSLDVGTHSVVLKFDGEAILANETSGTFMLSSLRVIQSIGYTLLDERAIATTTQAYKHTAFEASQNNAMLYLPLVTR